MTWEVLTGGCHTGVFHPAHKLACQGDNRLRLLMKATVADNLADTISIEHRRKA